MLDLADGVDYSYVPDSLTIDLGSGTTVTTSQVAERYGGAVADWEAKGNAVISWSQVITRDSPTGMAVLEQEIDRADPPGERFVEWARIGMATPLYYERRGPGTYQIVERWDDGQVAVIGVSVPVAPAPYGPPVTLTPAAQTLPATFDLAGVPGTLWATADVTMALPAGTPGIAWAMLAPHQGDFGIREAESATSNSGNWTGVAASGTARGGSMLQIASAAPSTAYYLTWPFTGATMNDAEMEQDITLEVWARFRYDPSLVVAPVIALWAAPAGAGANRYSLDFGAPGRQIGNASTGAAWFLHRVGLLRPSPEVPWAVTVEIQTGPVASGEIDLDYALFVPGRWRACSPTGLPLDSAYPAFQPGTGAVIKTVRRDLAGLVATSGVAAHQDTGLGGSPLFVPPGASKLLVAASVAIPDDPSATAPGDVLGPSLAPVVTITPRYRPLDSP